MTDPAGTQFGAGRVAAIYVRVSEAKEQDRTPAQEQLAACRALAGELGYAVTDETTLSDIGSNTTLARPGMTALLGLIARGDAGAVITHTLDRLARPQSTSLGKLLMELRRRDVRLYIAKVAKGYRYDAETGELVNNPRAVAAANLEEWRPPEHTAVARKDGSAP